MQPQLRPQVKVIKNWEFNDFFIFTNNFGDEKMKKNNLGLAIKHACSKFRELIQNPKFYDKDTVEEMR